MKYRRHISFLKYNSPLPKDSYLDEKLINYYAKVIESFRKSKDEKVLKYILKSFSDSEGVGMFDEVIDIVSDMKKEKVLPHLKKNLISNNVGVVYWNTILSLSFPDESLISYLLNNLNRDGSDIRMFTILSLKEINTDESKKIIINHINNEKDEKIRLEMIEECKDLL